MDFAEAVLALEAALKIPVWVLVQNDPKATMVDDLDEAARLAFFLNRDELKEAKEGAALLIDSPGGQAKAAFQIAMLFRRHCGRFTAIVPRYAKSAATLLLLGADDLYMGVDAELGPLDVQLWDDDSEERRSALDEVQSIERLNSVALSMVDQLMFLLVPRTRKKTDVLLPIVMDFVAGMMEPLISTIDAVHYTQRERVLKVAEDYAVRLLQPKYQTAQAEKIARSLVNDYAEHGFVIGREEARTLLQDSMPDPSAEVATSIDDLESLLTCTQLTAVGRIIEKVDT